MDKCNRTREADECCCNCAYHIPDHSHPTTDGGSINDLKGWLCFWPEIDGAFSGWGEHGMCECWEPKIAEEMKELKYTLLKESLGLALDEAALDNDRRRIQQAKDREDFEEEMKQKYLATLHSLENPNGTAR